MTANSLDRREATGRTSRPDPVVGWRVWRLVPESGELGSLSADYRWVPGVNESVCLGSSAIPRACVTPDLARCAEVPGPGCSCGFWALWDLGEVVARERAFDILAGRIGVRHVVGLISGWGLVALHGSEGFRAQRARVACLLADSPWDRGLDRLLGWSSRWQSRLWRPALSHGRRGAGSEARGRLLLESARRYGVPLLALPDALRLGVLVELGLSEAGDRVLRERLRPPRGTRAEDGRRDA